MRPLSPNIQNSQGNSLARKSGKCMVHCMVMVSMNLTRPVSHLQCTKIIWQSKHQKEKDTLLQRFLTHGLKKQNVATKSVT
jgi:hypothetical protein